MKKTKNKIRQMIQQFPFVLFCFFTSLSGIFQTFHVQTCPTLQGVGQYVSKLFSPHPSFSPFCEPYLLLFVFFEPSHHSSAAFFHVQKGRQYKVLNCNSKSSVAHSFATFTRCVCYQVTHCCGYGRIIFIKNQRKVGGGE